MEMLTRRNPHFYEQFSGFFYLARSVVIQVNESNHDPNNELHATSYTG